MWVIAYHAVIVLLCAVQAKCERYLPEEDTEDTFGDFRVVVDSVVEADGYSVRNVSVQVWEK